MRLNLRSKPVLEIFGLSFLLLLGIAAVLLCSQIADQASLYGTVPAGQSQLQGQLSAEAAETTLQKAENLLRTQTASSEGGLLPETPIFSETAWLSLLQTDTDALGIFLQRLATSPLYLRQQKDDSAFAKDFWNVLLSVRLQLPAPAVVTQPPAFTNGQNRIVWLAQALKHAGFTIPREWLASGLVDSEAQAGNSTAPSALLGLTFDSLPAGTETLVFGRRQLHGKIQQTATETNPTNAASNSAGNSLRHRTFLQVKNRVAAATAVTELTDEATGVDFGLDTRNWSPGLYDTEIFVIASDGRGHYLSLGSLEVPVIEIIAYGTVKEMSLAQPENDIAAQSGQNSAGRFVEFYPLETEQGWIYELTVANPGIPIATELFNLDGERIAYCDNPDTRWEGLRALIQSEPDIPTQDRVAYAWIGEKTLAGEAAALTSGQISQSGQNNFFGGLPAWATGFTIVQSGRAATLRGNPDEVFAILTPAKESNAKTELTVQDKTGNQQKLPAANLDIVEFPGRLTLLALSTGREAASYFPEFDPETTEFGLYLPAGSGPLTLHLAAREGSFARLQADIKSTAPVPASPITADAGLTVTLPELVAESTLEILVNNGLGEARTYQVHIIPSRPEEGYHRLLEAFPPSYRSPLYLLHKQQPNYNFVADQFEIPFAEFVAAQDYRDRSLIEADAVPSSWVKPDSPVYDGRSWKAAVPEVIAHFADPRNFLNERDIFQFELLRFQPQAHTREGVAAVLDNSFMAAGSELNPENLEYDRLLVEAGETANINPLFLASRIIQEMGRNGESPLAFGRLPGYEGVYNFYNIGSTPNPSVPNGAQINGARYALFGRNPDEQLTTPDEEVYLLPWLSPVKAITGGAIWISERYVGIGQDTLYLQKFDLVSTELYSHQYAQNIQMAWAEGRRTQSSYRNAGLIEQAFTFRIPVFLEMPAKPALLPDTPSRIIR